MTRSQLVQDLRSIIAELNPVLRGLHQLLQGHQLYPRVMSI